MPRDVIHVRDSFTGATFPVKAEPVKIKGFQLRPPEEGERNRRAELVEVEVYIPAFVAGEEGEEASSESE